MNDIIAAETKRMRNVVTMFLICFFGTIFTMNIIFVFLATTTTNGLVNDNPYKYGINYNEVLKMKRYMNEISYKTEVIYADNIITINIIDKNGAIEIADKNISFSMFHPIHKNFDFIPKVNKTKNTGQYIINNPDFKLSGTWEVRINVNLDNNKLVTKHRIFVNNVK